MRHVLKQMKLCYLVIIDAHRNQTWRKEFVFLIKKMFWHRTEQCYKVTKERSEYIYI